VVERVAGRTAVFGNIDAVRFGIHATLEEMSAEVERQADIGRGARGFVASTGSPFPLETDVRMIDAMITAAHAYNMQAPINKDK
jgi:uroporphyrinogen-III decarboxylase